MRKIKWDTNLFKVWDGKKFWDNKISIVNSIDEMYCGDVDDLVFLENTFSVDQNGVEIYEGDIIHHPNMEETFKVIFKAPTFTFLSTLDNETWNMNQEELTRCVEVIGNIYENPELLELEL